jgi:hypothetical protein
MSRIKSFEFGHEKRREYNALAIKRGRDIQKAIGAAKNRVRLPNSIKNTDGARTAQHLKKLHDDSRRCDDRDAK